MNINLVIYGISAVAVIAFLVALKKHGTLSAVEASAKREIAYLESISTKVGATIKSDFDSAVARLKAIF